MKQPLCKSVPPSHCQPSRHSFVKHLRTSPLSEVVLRPLGCAGPGFMPSPARLTMLRSTCGAPSPRRCLTRGMESGIRSTSDGVSEKFCHRPAHSTPVRSACEASWVRRCLTQRKGTWLRSTSDGPLAKFCHGPAHLTPSRSTSVAPWVRRSRGYALTCAPDPAQKHLWGTLPAQVFDMRAQRYQGSRRGSATNQ